MEINKTEHGKAVAALVLGIVSCASILTGFGAFVGLIVGIIGIVLARMAKNAGNTESICKAGFVLSIIGLCLSALGVVMVLGVLGLAGAAGMAM